MLGERDTRNQTQFPRRPSIRHSISSFNYPLTFTAPTHNPSPFSPPSFRGPFKFPCRQRGTENDTFSRWLSRFRFSFTVFSASLSLWSSFSFSLFFISNPLLLLRPQCFLRHFQNFIATIRNCSKEMTINREHLVHRWKTVRDAPKRSTITVVTSWFVVKEPRATRRKTTANRRKKASKQAKKKKRKKKKEKEKWRGKEKTQRRPLRSAGS